MVDAKEVVVNYDPKDPFIDNAEIFVSELDRLCKSGISCNIEISVNANNHLNGIKLERKIENLKNTLDTNEFIKKLTKWHADTDRKLTELSAMCLGERNE